MTYDYRLYQAVYTMATGENQFVKLITESPGIHFDPIGSLSLVDSRLSVVIPVDISFINPHIINLDYILNNSKILCQKSKTFDFLECDNLLQPLITRHKDIVRDNEAISYLMSRQTKRSAPLSFIGTLSKKLFGTMDEDDAIRYDKAILEVESDNKKIASLLKDNILITTSTLKSFNETVNVIKYNENQLSLAIDSLYKDVKNLTYVSEELGIRSRVLELISMIENSLLSLSFKVEDIVNSIMFSKSNILYPTILTPIELYSQLVDNYRFIPNSKQLPVLLTLGNIHTILNISSLSSYFNKDKIVMVLEIPLVKPSNFYLYHNLPYPVAHDIHNPVSYTTIIPSTKYIGISKDKSVYCTAEDLTNCKIVNDDHYLCNIPITHSTAANPSCETEIISKVLTSVPEICKTSFFHGHVNIWQPLRNNKWLYVMTEKSRLNIECNSTQLKELDISASGILYLPQGCVAYCKDTRLVSQSYVNVMLNTVKFNLNILNDSCCNKLAFNNIVPNLPPVSLKNVNLDSLNYNNIETIKELDKIIEKPHIVLYGNVYSTLTIVIVSLIFLYMFYIIYVNLIHNKIKCKQPQNPNPDIPEPDEENISMVNFAPPLRIG